MRLPAVKSLDVRQPDLYVAEVRRHVEPFWCEVTSDADAERCKRVLTRKVQFFDPQTEKSLLWAD